MTFGSSAGGTTPARIARIDAASFARAEAQPDTRPVEQKRLVAEIDQPPETGRIHRAAHVLNQKIERGVGGRRQLLEGEELAQVRREGDEVAAAFGGLLAQHVPEAGAHVRRNREQQSRGIAARCLRHERRKLILARRAPALVLGDKQPIRPAASQMKVRRDRECRLHSAAASPSWAAAIRSSLVSATSKVTCLCRRHDSVSVVAKSPFSKNLLPGGPPPQNGA